jgi:opacity protein-like surface antigen
MNWFKPVFLSASLVLSNAGLATAADLDIPPEYIPPEPPVVHASGGWYLRGDVGYSHMNLASVTILEDAHTSATYTPTHTKFTYHELGSAWMLGGGIGYQINDYFRVDATANYHMSASLSGNSASALDPFPCDYISDDNGDGDTCVTSDKGGFQATTLMANGYLDLGSYMGFTPYVGAGVGGAYVHWEDMKNDLHCTEVGDCLDNGGMSYDHDFDGVHGGEAGWRFAYALHAGTSYALTSNLKLDAGYSFTHISDGEMFGFAKGSGDMGVQGHHGDIKIHTWRAGLRYQFD